MNLKWPWQLYHWHFEISAKCALSCPRCPRTEHSDTPWLNKELSLDFFKQLMTEDLIKTHVERITFCGDVGDPIYAKDLIPVIRYIKSVKHSVQIYIITNGSYKTAQWWHELASVLNQYDTINFSVDGFDQQSNNLYRVNSNWDSIVQGMKIMASSEAFVYWAAIIFKFNEEKIDQIRTLAKDYGCDGIQLTKSTKFGSKYDVYGGSTDPLEPSIANVSNTDRYQRYVENFGTNSNKQRHIDGFLKTMSDRYEQVKDNIAVVPLCSTGNRGLYVNADGLLFPCSWTSFPFKQMNHGARTIKYEQSMFVQNRDKYSLYTRTLEQVLNDDSWSKIFSNVDNPRKCLVECLKKCGSDVVDRDYAVQYHTN